MQDFEIVELYWQRNELAIQETEKKYSKYLSAIAYNILADLEDTKESVNDTYMGAWNSMPPNRPNVLSTYLGKITRRVAIDIVRRKTRQKRKTSEYALSLDELNDCVTIGATIEQEIDAQLLSNAINNFLRTQSQEVRNTFIGRYYYLDSLKDVARYCNMSESKVKSMLHRTRCKLKEYLEKEGFNI